MSDLREIVPDLPETPAAAAEIAALEPAEFWPLEPWPPQPVPDHATGHKPLEDGLPAAETDSPTDGAALEPFDGTAPSAEMAIAAEGQPAEESPLFQSYAQPEIAREKRIPHFGHLCLLGAIALFGSICAGFATFGAMLAHLFGVTNLDQANENVAYALGSMAIFYVITFACSFFIFPLLWHKGFFAGLQWRGSTALRMRWRLFGAAFACFVFALISDKLMPGPENTPIERLFSTTASAWLMFAFAVTAAPFFEEMGFRGFLLPALCTAFDWTVDKSLGRAARPLDANGHPQWSLLAMVVASVVTSLPFAMMHGWQNGHAVGALVLLWCVSMVLCWARLSTRSLAASVLVHASYNFLLFLIMMLGTGGFRHLDKM
jgi:membrane protease YdiL (CAAX protease family)